MATQAEIMQALRAAHEAGDEEAARRFAQMYQAAGSEKPRQTQKTESFDPTEGMSGFDKFAAGYGKAGHDLYMGAKQLLNVGDQTQLQKDIEESRRLDAPLMNTGAGKAGHIVGSIVDTGPTAAIPGANTVLGGAAIGAGLGLLSPSENDQEAQNNLLGGAAGGGLGVLAGRAIPSVYNAFISPFFKNGQEKIVGNVLKNSARDPKDLLNKLQTIEELVPGSKPSVAEVALDPEISVLQKATRNILEARGPLVDAEIANNAARLAAIRSIAQDDAAMEAAKAARTEATKGLYDNLPFVQGDDELQKILLTPAGQKAIVKAKEYAGNQYRTFGEQLPSMQGLESTLEQSPFDVGFWGNDLHQVQRGLKSVASDPSVDPVSRKSVGSVLDDFNSWIANKAPDIHAANKAYAEASKPINQMEIGQALKNKLTPALTESGLPTRERAAMFAEAIRNQDALVKKTTGMNQRLDEVMTPEQMSLINGIKKDLERKANALDLASARGSDTAQNLIADNMLRNLIGPIGMPESWLSKTVGNALVNAVPRRAIDLVAPSVERRVQGLLGEAMANPEIAAGLLDRALMPQFKHLDRAASLIPAASYGLLVAN